MDESVFSARVGRLRERRVWKGKDLTLGGMKKDFEREVARPYRQLAGVAAWWAEHVPGELVGQTRLEGLSREVLRVTVGGAPAMYELDRALREGLERELLRAFAGKVRKVRLSVGVVEGAEDRGDESPR
ncbi:MAG: hypothetical protein AAGI68_11575 [Planctomycetota bacterium]